MDEKSTWIPTWQAMNNVSWFVRICVKPTSEIISTQNGFLMIRPLNKSHGPSQVHGHGAWLMCEGALTLLFELCMGGQWLGIYSIHRFFANNARENMNLLRTTMGVTMLSQKHMYL